MVHRNARVILGSGAVWSVVLLPAFVFLERSIRRRLKTTTIRWELVALYALLGLILVKGCEGI